MNITNTPLWFVTKPRPLSELGDICFSTSWAGLQRQFRGGLEASEIVGVYTTDREALQHAKQLLQERDS